MILLLLTKLVFPQCPPPRAVPLASPIAHSRDDSRRQQHGAINLAQGFPDSIRPRRLCEAGKQAMDAGRHQYAITWGAPELRTALAAKLTRFMGLPVDPNRELVVTCGATEAMMVAMMTVCDPGDRVGLFSPFYENYAADAILAGATPVHVAARAARVHLRPAELRRAFRRG